MVTVSPSGPPGLFKGVTTALVGSCARFSRVPSPTCIDSSSGGHDSSSLSLSTFVSRS
jgi:hypothetical protein